MEEIAMKLNVDERADEPVSCLANIDYYLSCN